MNCQTFEDVVIDLARSVPMDAPVREEALAHSASCESCARRLAGEKLLTGGLQALADEMKLSAPPDYVQQNLIQELGKQKFLPQREGSDPRWRYLAVAAAILLAAALGIAGYKMRNVPPVDSQAYSNPPAEVQTPIASTTPVKELVKTSTTTANPKRRPIVTRKQRVPRSRPDASLQSTFVTVVVGAIADPETTEVASPYMALGYTNPANIQDGVQVVRVEVPRYAMARFGLPVNMERYDERVKADVWVGADGLARAIRFVQ